MNKTDREFRNKIKWNLERIISAIRNGRAFADPWVQKALELQIRLIEFWESESP